MKLKKYLDTLPAVNTQASYLTSMKVFLEYVYGKPVADLENADRHAETYLKEVKKGRKPIEDILAMAAKLTRLNKAPKTITARVSVARGFLEFAGYEFRKNEEKMMRQKTKGARAITRDKIPDAEAIKKILAVGSPLLRVYIMVINSTGMRRAEVLSIRKEWIDFSSDPVRITLPVRDQKRGTASRVCYLTHEAREALNHWLEARENYLRNVTYFGQSYDTKTRTKIPENQRKSREQIIEERIKDPRIFPISPASIGGDWGRAVKAAGLDKRHINTNRRILHLHGFRKRVRSELAKGSENSVDQAERILGHNGYLSDSYVRIDDDQNAEWFKDNQHLLAVYQPINLKDPAVEKLMEEKDREITSLKERVNMLEAREEVRTVHKEEILRELIAHLKQHPEDLPHL